MTDYSNLQPGIYIDNVDDPLLVGPHGRSSWGDQSLEYAIEAVLVHKRGWLTEQIEDHWNLRFGLPLEFLM